MLGDFKSSQVFFKDPTNLRGDIRFLELGSPQVMELPSHTKRRKTRATLNALIFTLSSIEKTVET
jgi:hypothetical protein